MAAKGFQSISLRVAYPYLDRWMFSRRFLQTSAPTPTMVAADKTRTAIPAFFPLLIPPEATACSLTAYVAGVGAGDRVGDGEDAEATGGAGGDSEFPGENVGDGADGSDAGA